METRFKAIKKRLNSFSGWRYLLGGAVLLVFMWQCITMQHLLGEIHFQSPYLLILIPLLTFLAWMLEFLKWNQIHKILSEAKPIQILQAFKKGMLTGILTPASLGNFVGRMNGFTERDKDEVVKLTLFGNAAQFLSSIYLGGIGLFYFEDYFKLAIPAYFLWFSLLVGVLFFLFLQKVGWKGWSWELKGIPFLLRLQILNLSFLRSAVFILQFTILLTVFTGQFEWNYFPMVALFYLFTTLSPSVFIGKLLVRESIALWLFPLLGVGGISALAASSLLWLVNNGMTALWALTSLNKKKEYA